MKTILNIINSLVISIMDFALRFGLLLVGVVLLQMIFNINTLFGILFILFILLDTLVDYKKGGS